MDLPFFYRKTASVTFLPSTFSFMFQAFIYSVKALLIAEPFSSKCAHELHSESCCFLQTQTNQPPQEEEEDAEVEETEELGHVDTYAEYKPSKCMPASTLSFTVGYFTLHSFSV